MWTRASTIGWITRASIPTPSYIPSPVTASTRKTITKERDQTPESGQATKSTVIFITYPQKEKRRDREKRKKNDVKRMGKKEREKTTAFYEKKPQTK